MQSDINNWYQCIYTLSHDMCGWLVLICLYRLRKSPDIWGLEVQEMVYFRSRKLK